jgi:hypothetical protein
MSPPLALDEKFQRETNASELLLLTVVERVDGRDLLFCWLAQLFRLRLDGLSAGLGPGESRFLRLGYTRALFEPDELWFGVDDRVLSVRMRRPACQRRWSPDPIVFSCVEQLAGGHSGGGGVSWSL